MNHLIDTATTGLLLAEGAAPAAPPGGALGNPLMLIAIVALVAMFNWMLGVLPVRFCDGSPALGYSVTCSGAGDTAVMGTPLQLTMILGVLFAPVALLMGGEGRGVSENLRKRCDRIVSIPLAGRLESLNVSVAAAVLMYEKRRQDGWFEEPD